MEARFAFEIPLSAFEIPELYPLILVWFFFLEILPFVSLQANISLIPYALAAVAPMPYSG